MKSPVSIIVTILVVAVIAYVRMTFIHVIGAVTTPSSARTACLEMLGSTTSDENGANYIVGSIKNNCDHSFNNITIAFKLDRTNDDFPSGPVFAYGRDLAPGETLNFKSALPVSPTATFHLDTITAY